MGKNLDNLVKNRIAEEKRENQAKKTQKIKAEIEKKKKEFEEKKKENERKKAQEAKDKAFSKVVYDNILRPYFASDCEELRTESTVIFPIENGNICGKYNNVYFMTFQKGTTTFVRTFVPSTTVVYDGDHYSPRETVAAFDSRVVELNKSGKPKWNTVSSRTIPEYDYKHGMIDMDVQKMYETVKNVQNKVDAKLNKTKRI